MQVHIPEIRCTAVAGSRWIWVKMNVTSILRNFLVYFLGFDLIEGTIICIHYQQKQPPEMFFKKSVLKNFAKFTGNICASVSFLIKFQVSLCNFIKKETLAQVFSREFWWCFWEHLFYRTPQNDCFCINPFHTIYFFLFMPLLSSFLMFSGGIKQD